MTVTTVTIRTHLDGTVSIDVAGAAAENRNRPSQGLETAGWSCSGLLDDHEVTSFLKIPLPRPRPRSLRRPGGTRAAGATPGAGNERASGDRPAPRAENRARAAPGAIPKPRERASWAEVAASEGGGRGSDARKRTVAELSAAERCRSGYAHRLARRTGRLLEREMADPSRVVSWSRSRVSQSAQTDSVFCGGEEELKEVKPAGAQAEATAGGLAGGLAEAEVIAGGLAEAEVIAGVVAEVAETELAAEAEAVEAEADEPEMAATEGVVGVTMAERGDCAWEAQQRAVGLAVQHAAEHGAVAGGGTGFLLYGGRGLNAYIGLSGLRMRSSDFDFKVVAATEAAFVEQVQVLLGAVNSKLARPLCELQWPSDLAEMAVLLVGGRKQVDFKWLRVAEFGEMCSQWGPTEQAGSSCYELQGCYVAPAGWLVWELQQLLQGEVPGWRIEKMQQQLDAVAAAQVLGVWCSGQLESPEQVVERLAEAEVQPELAAEPEAAKAEAAKPELAAETEADATVQAGDWQVPLECLQADHSELASEVESLKARHNTLNDAIFRAKEYVLTESEGQYLTLFKRIARLERYFEPTMEWICMDYIALGDIGALLSDALQQEYSQQRQELTESA
eukprot:TRINITY_DN15085_c0_g1_i1.p1 TRINITY_DN15085_c0_g1~~TRINITY_DN15085_c0_g1_i1.p1  ORF type:complete len:619 (+),score=144.36 TRINITY_DN15085_c0_g1_i1:255-2111(+)